MEKARILIVDDEEDLRDVLAHQLRGLNATIDTAENGRTALGLAKQNWYDAILSDISMPEMSGLEFLAGLREKGVDSPFVFLTGFGDKSKALEALRLGAFDFMEKPWEPETLRTTMGKAVELGLRLRNLDAELEQILAGFQNITPQQRNELKSVQKSILLMKIHRNLLDKKAS